MPMAAPCSILRQFDLETAVERVQASFPTPASADPSTALRTWLGFLPPEVTGRLQLALQQAVPFMPPDFTPAVLAVANDNVPPLTHIDVICVCVHQAMESGRHQTAAALIFTVDRALYRFGRSKPLLRVVRELRRVSPATAVAPQVTLRQARVLKDEGDLNGALKVLRVIINREDGWQYPEERQYLDTKAACLHVEGQIYHNLELWHSAIPPLVEGFQIFCEVQDRKGISSVLHVLSRCLCRLQQDQYDRFRLSHPDVFEESDPCYEGYRQGKTAVDHVQHTEDSFFVVKHQLVADESLLMFAVQNPCQIHFQQHLMQILQEIQSSLRGYKSVSTLQNVESFVEFVRAVFLASLVFFQSWATADKKHADRLETLSLEMYAAMCCGQKDSSPPSASKQTTTQPTSFEQTSESVGFMNEALALLGLPQLQWKDEGSADMASSSDTALKSLQSDPTHHSHAAQNSVSEDRQLNDLSCSAGKTGADPEKLAGCPSSNHGTPGQSDDKEAEDKGCCQSRDVDDTPKGVSHGDGQSQQVNSSDGLMLTSSARRPVKIPDKTSPEDLAVEQSEACHHVDKSEGRSCSVDSHHEPDLENACQSDSCKPEVDCRPERKGLEVYEEDSREQPANSQPHHSGSSLKHGGKRLPPGSVAQSQSSHHLDNQQPLSEARELCREKPSTQTSSEHDTIPEPLRTYHGDSMTTSAQGERGQRTVGMDTSVRAYTFPARSSRKQSRGRGSAGKRARDRYVGLAMSREELRAATWPALAPDAESSLEEDDCTQQEEDENLDALSITTNTTASSHTSSKNSTQDVTSPGHDIVSNMPADPDSVHSNRSAEDSKSGVHNVPPAASPAVTAENTAAQTGHACRSCCSQARAGCSTVDQHASTKSSTPLTPDVSVSSLLSQRQHSREGSQHQQESDSLLSGLRLSQEQEHQQHTPHQQQQQQQLTWQPSKAKQVHRAVLLTFDVWTGLWRQQSTLIHMGEALPLTGTAAAGDGPVPTHANPRGAFRDAFLVSFLHQGEPLARYVGKKYRKQRPPKDYMRDVTDQMMASHYVTLFNDALSRQQNDFLTIHFLPAFHLQVVTREGEVCDWLNVEPYMDGRYDKITNNASYVASNRPHLLTGMQVATAFSHFSYVNSQGRYMVVDLQGCVPDDNKGVIYLTDPVLHSTDTACKERSSPFDRHERGIEDFFQRVHTHCNDVCRLLHLDQHRPVPRKAEEC